MVKKISVVIVNYNAGDDLRSCVNSVLKQTGCEIEVIISDNDSHDNSLDLLKPLSDNVNIILNKANLGFGKACNIGFKHATGDYVFYLNPDALIVESDGLHKMLDFMETQPHYGLIGPKVMSHNELSEPQYRYMGEQHLKQSLESLPGKVAWVIGAAMFARREVVEKIKGFDEDYFLYGEELDLCLRVRRAGWAVGFFDSVTIEHVGGTTVRLITQREHWTRRQKGAVLFYQKSYSKSDAVRLIKRDLKIAQRQLFIRKFFKNELKQIKYAAIRDVCKAALQFG